MLKAFFPLVLAMTSSIVFCQKSKTPVFPLPAQVSDSSCTPACHFFEFDVDKLIATDNFTFEAMVDNSKCIPLPNRAETGCLLSTHNPQWLLVKPLSGTHLFFEVSNSESKDIDAALWGPITLADLNNTCETLENFPLDCDYSEGPPTLELENPEINGYYLMLITNFSNAPTTITLKQPQGGTVKYTYYCPYQIDLNKSIIGTQTQKALNTIKLATPLVNLESLQLFAGSSIELLPGFESKDSTILDAKIQSCLNTTEVYLSPADTTICEVFSNHTANTPHIYSNYSQNELIGTVFAKRKPQYLAYGQWYDMSRIGKDTASDRYLWGLRHPYLYETNIALRTAQGCPVYFDTRTVKVSNYLGLEDIAYPSLYAVTDTAYIDSPFWLSSDMTQSSGNHPVYVMYLKPGLGSQLSYRINGGPRLYNAQDINYYESYNQRYVRITKIGPFSAPKDFIIDFTPDHGQSYDRYYLARTSAGGHFAVTTTFTRAADSTVTVSTFQGDINVRMQLGNYNPTTLFGNCFHLGKLPEGNHELPFQSMKKEYILDERMFVKVRYN